MRRQYAKKFEDSFVIFQGSLPSSIVGNSSQHEKREGGGYGVKSNDNIASMEQTNQLSDHPLAIDAVNVESIWKTLLSLYSFNSKKWRLAYSLY